MENILLVLEKNDKFLLLWKFPFYNFKALKDKFIFDWKVSKDISFS